MCEAWHGEVARFAVEVTLMSPVERQQLDNELNPARRARIDRMLGAK